MLLELPGILAEAMPSALLQLMLRLYHSQTRKPSTTWLRNQHHTSHKTFHIDEDKRHEKMQRRQQQQQQQQQQKQQKQEKRPLSQLYLQMRLHY